MDKKGTPAKRLYVDALDFPAAFGRVYAYEKFGGVLTSDESFVYEYCLVGRWKVTRRLDAERADE